MNQIAVQHNYLLKQIYINGGNMFRLLSKVSSFSVSYVYGIP
jgi:hypothetical protein